MTNRFFGFRALGAGVLLCLAAMAPSCAMDTSDEDDAVASIEAVQVSNGSGSGSSSGGYCSAYDSSCEWCAEWNGATVMDVPGPINTIPNPGEVSCSDFVKACFKVGKISRQMGLNLYRAYVNGYRGVGGGCAGLLAYCAGLTYPNNNNCVALATQLGCP